jgi:hypothetical protein
MSASTGPRTSEGKAIVSRNAVRHGLTAEEIVTPRESAQEWEEFRLDVIGAVDPVGALEFALTDRVASLLWRLRRVPLAECEWLRESVKLNRPLPNIDALQVLSRYEAHLNRQLVHSIHELEALQQRRKGHPAPLARLDVLSDGGKLNPAEPILPM